MPNSFKINDKFFKTLVDSSLDAFVVVDLKGIILFANQEFARIHGLDSPDEWIGKSGFELIVPEERDAAVKLMSEIGETGIAKDIRFNFLKKNGQMFPVELNVKILQSNKQQPASFLMNVRDITDRIKLDNALLESQRQISSLMSNLPGMAYKCKNDKNWTMEFISDGVYNLSGYKAADLIENNKISFSEIVYPEDREKKWESIQESLLAKVPFRINFRIITAQKEIKWVLDKGQGIYDADGNLTAIEGFVTDITDHKRAEDALTSLSTSYAKLSGKDFIEAVSKHIAENMNLDYVYVGKLTNNNNSIEVIGGYALGQKMGDLTYNLEFTPCKNVIDQNFQLHSENIQKIFPKDQLLIDMDIEGYIGSPLINHDGTSIGIIVGLNKRPLKNIELTQKYFKIFIDRIIAEIAKSNAEEALKLSEDRLSKTMMASKDGLWDWNIKSNEVYFDPRYYTMAGYDVDEFEYRLEEFQKRVHQDDIDYVMEEANKHLLGEIDSFKVEFRFKKKSGDWLWIMARGVIVEYDQDNKPTRFIGTHTDISARKKVEEEVIKNQEKFQSMFDNSPVPLWEEDFTEVDNFLESLKENGVSDFRTYFDENPDDVLKCSQLIKIVDVNKAAIQLHEANSKEELLGNLDKLFTEESFTVFKEEIIALTEGKTDFSAEGVVKTLKGNRKYVYLKFNIDKEKDYKKAILATVDITKQNSALEALKESEERFKFIFDYASTSIWVEDFSLIKKRFDELQNEGIDNLSEYFDKNPDEVIKLAELVKVLDVNESGVKLLKAKDKNDLIKTLPSYFTNESIKVFKEELIALGNGEDTFESVIPIKTQWGETLHFIMSLSVPVRYKETLEKVLVSFTDVTERIGIERALSESEGKYRSLIENSNDAIYLLYNRKFEMINNKFSEIFGYNFEDVSHADFDFMHLVAPESRIIIDDRMRKAKRGEELTPKYEFTAIAKNGDLINCEVNTTYLRYKEGTATQGIIRDITDRKKSEEELRKLSRAVEQSPVSVMITDEHGKIEYVNPKFTSISGYTIDEVVGKNPRILKSDYWQTERYKELWNTITNGGVWRGEFYNKKKNGEHYWELASISPIKNSHGLITHFIAIKEDITDRKKIEELLINSEKFIKGISDASPAIIYLYDIANNENIYINRTVERSLGYSVEEIKNMGVSFFPTMTHPDDLPNVTEHFKIIEQYCESLIEGNKSLSEINLSDTPVFTMSFRLKRRDGKYIWFQSWDTIHKVDEKGKIEQLLGAALDISEKKAIESELVKAKEKAERSDRIKSEFLAQMSHEIRTPLNVMLSYTTLLEEEMSNKDSAEHLEIFNSITNAGRRIIRTIDLILNASELQAGAYNLIVRKVDVFQDILLGVYNDLKHSAESKGIEMSLKRSVTNSFCSCDEYSIYQSVVNLVDNAIKYTDEGFIEIKLSRNSNKNLMIEIEDSGIGISDEYMSNLFEAFSQEETGYGRRFEGTGLGLSLVKNYCDLNNVKIEVQSDKNKGTKFSLIFNEL